MIIYPHRKDVVYIGTVFKVNGNYFLVKGYYKRVGMFCNKIRRGGPALLVRSRKFRVRKKRTRQKARRAGRKEEIQGQMAGHLKLQFIFDYEAFQG